MEQKLKELKSEVKSLLQEHPEGINVNSFWGCYDRKYHKLPDVKVFRVRKRSEILDLCSDVFRRVGSGGAAVIHMKPSEQTEQHQHDASTASEAPAGGNAYERIQSQSTRAQTSTETIKPTPAGGMNQFTGGGSFYERFYDENETDSDSIAKITAAAHNVTNAASRGSYSSLMGSYSRPSAAAAAVPVRSAAPASHPMMHAERFAVPSVPLPQFGWNTPLAAFTTVSQRYQTPRSRDSSASRSSDGAQNQSPAPGVRHAGPPHQAQPVPTPLLAVGRSSAPGTLMGGRGRRTNYSREQLNSAAEDCIDRLAVAKDYVSLEKISRVLCQDFEVSSLDELGLRQIDDLPRVNEHKRLECKVNAYIQNFVKVCDFQSQLLQSLYRYDSLDYVLMKLCVMNVSLYHIFTVVVMLSKDENL